MNPEVLQLSIVVIASDHNPTILNPDFLALQGIVPNDWEWELAYPPITTPPFSTVQYDSGVSISVEANKLQVVEHNVTNLSETKAVAIVQRYVEVVPHVLYTAVGTNFRSTLNVEDADTYLKTRFLKNGPWIKGNNIIESVGLRLVYPVDCGRLVLSLDRGTVEKTNDGQLNKEPVIIANANFHRDVNINEPPTNGQIPKLLDEISNDWVRFQDILTEMSSTLE